MDEDVVVSREMLRAIGAETRINLLKAMRKRQKTQSELATELGISAPTVLEHMGQLENAGLIELVPEYAERKWKYYRLTRTAQDLVEGRRMNVIMLLASSSAVITGALIGLYLLLPPIISSLTGMPTGTARNYTYPTSSCGGGTCIASALGSLETSSRSLLGLVIMLLLFVTFAFGVAYLAERIGRKRM